MSNQEAMLEQIRHDDSIRAWLERRGERVEAVIRNDPAEYHCHAEGLSVSCSRCFEVLEEYDRVFPFGQRPR